MTISAPIMVILARLPLPDIHCLVRLVVIGGVAVDGHFAYHRVKDIQRALAASEEG
jgi:hypothetical protein